MNVERYGNTSCATIPIALSEAYRAGRLHEGDTLAICGFGGGLAWGAMILQYSRTGVPPRERARVPAAVAGG